MNNEEIVNSDPEGSLNSSKPITRREFLRTSAIALGGLFLASCSVDPSRTSAFEEDPFDENVMELNSQFETKKEFFLKNDGTFNYDRYTSINPQFANYIVSIDEFSKHTQAWYGINPNAMKALTSSIVVSNINNQDPIDNSADRSKQRLGIMQFYPTNVVDTYHKRIDQNRSFTIEDMSIDSHNINYGMVYLAETLRDIKNNGDNKDLMDLMLAYYYGGDPLLNVVKGNSNVDTSHYLYSNYARYINSKKYLESKESLSMDQIWNKALEWKDTNFFNNKEIFFKEAEKYCNDEYNQRLNLTKEQYLTVFLAIAKTESNGGVYLQNTTSGALGWYQIIPQWQHLEKYNSIHNTNYTYEQVGKNDAISIDVGIWTLMQYRHQMDMKQLMMMFKGGNNFPNNPDDRQWWNSVCDNIKTLAGSDFLNMGEI